MRRVSVIGLGYVGLTFSACLADRGFKVYGVDIDEEKRRLISDGRPPIYEEGIEPLLKRAISSTLDCLSKSMSGGMPQQRSS